LRSRIVRYLDYCRLTALFLGPVGRSGSGQALRLEHLLIGPLALPASISYLDAMVVGQVQRTGESQGGQHQTAHP
jgi:hypothetical protein